MRSLAGLVLVLTLALPAAPVVAQPVVQEYTVPAGSHPHDVAPAADGGVWFTAQSAGYLGWLDPNTGETRKFPLGPRSAPHGVIVGPDGAPWVTDGGQNAIVRVDPSTSEVRAFPLPSGRGANLNTAAFDRNGSLWFTGQSGVYGKVDPSTAEVKVWSSPRGSGPYGITSTPDGRVFYASNVGQVGRYDPRTGAWSEWKLPGSRPMTYAVYVDEQDTVWLTDFGANAIVRFDPLSETFEQFVLPLAGADVRQLNGRPGELWGAESGQDRIVVVRH
jgi:virginiamycin B lyase